MHVPNTHPIAKPPTTAETYRAGREWRRAFATQEAAAQKPPNITTGRGPYRSTSQPSTGDNHVFTKIMMVNATWIAARLQWFSSCIGLTNSVHPYCRLASRTVERTAKASCAHRARQFHWVFCGVIKPSRCYFAGGGACKIFQGGIHSAFFVRNARHRKPHLDSA